MRYFGMFITVVCLLLLVKLRWPKNKCLLYFTFLRGGGGGGGRDNFWDVWEEEVFLKGLVKFREIRNIKDLM